MLIGQYDLEVFTPPCEPGAERLAAKARLQVDITEVLPYLNATLHGALFHAQSKALTWKKGGHNIAFHAYEIATSNIEDREGAEKEIRGLVDLVNRTWERRNEIIPSVENRQRPTPMVVYQFLPHTNCRECGDATCWIFAAKLATYQKTLNECPLLSTEAYSNQRKTLEELL